MAATQVLILGHSFVHRLYSFIDSSSSPMFTLSLGLKERIIVRWHGIGGTTEAKVLEYNLHVMESFKPQIVILELGTNDLSHLEPTTVGSSLEDLTQALHSCFAVQRVVVCRAHFRDKNPDF